MAERELNILLVEDDELDVMNVQRAFKKNNIGNPLYVAGNGLEALEMLRGTGPGAARAADTGGSSCSTSTCRRWAASSSSGSSAPTRTSSPLTVIVLTTSDEERDKVEAYELNVAGYILKPVTLEAFVEIMATLNKYWTVNELP